MDLPIKVQPSKRTDLQIKTANNTISSIPANSQLKQPSYAAPNPSQGIQQLTGQTPMPQSDNDDYYSQQQSYQQTINNENSFKNRKQPMQIQISPKKTQQIGKIDQGQEQQQQQQNKSQNQQNNQKESNDLSLKRNREQTLQSNGSKLERDLGRKSDEIVFKGDDDDDAVLQEPQQFNIKKDTKKQSEWYFNDKAVAIDVGSPFDDEEDINSPNFNSPSPKVSNQIIPTSSIFQPSLHRRRYDLNSQGKERKDQQVQGFQEKGSQNGQFIVTSEESKNSETSLTGQDMINKGNGLKTLNQQQKKSEFGYIPSVVQSDSRNGEAIKDQKHQIRSKQVQIQADQGQAQKQQGDENEEDNDNINSPTFFKPIIYKDNQGDNNNQFQIKDQQKDNQNKNNDKMMNNVNLIDNQNDLEIEEEQKGNIDGNNNNNINQDDNLKDPEYEQNNYSQNNRSKSNRKQSLFRYDPSMFQSVAGYYNPSASMQAETIEEWQMAKTNISQGYTSEEDSKKQAVFLKLAEEYLLESQRVYIQRINRQLNGLKSAENLGDYFIRKYPGIGQLERRIAGCSQAQTYPVYIGVRGDGNCFYRGIIVSHLCYLLSLSTPLKMFETLIMDIQNSAIQLIQMEYQGNIRGDNNRVKVILVQEFLVLLGQRVCISSSIESQVLMMKMFDRIATSHDFDYSLVCLARSMIYSAINKYAMQPPYCDFMLLEDIDRTKQKLCVYKEDAEYHVLSLSCEVFRHPLHILQLQKDKHGHIRFDHAITYQPQIELNSQQKQSQIDVEEDEENQRYRIYLLLSDGHYDLVFDRTTCLDYFPSLSLFTQHSKYREDLLQFAQKCEQTHDQEQLLEVQSLLYDYTQFLKQQSGQINRMRESFVQMHSLTVKNDKSTLQQDLHLFDTIMQGMQDDIHRNQYIPGLEHIPFAQEQDDPEINMIRKIEGSSQQIINSSKQIISEQEQFTIGIIADQKQRKLSQIAEVAADQADSVFPIDGKITHLQYQKSAPVSHDPSGQQQTQLERQCRDVYSLTYETDMNPKFYYNLNSDRLYRQKAASAARLEDRRKSTDKNKISAAILKPQSVQSFSSSSNVSGQFKAFPVCSHVSEVQITVSNIICCKLNLCVCYPCFKTRQFLRCPCCKKELLEQNRINVTAQNWKYVCRRCNPKNSKEIIVPLFNKLFCMNCDLQFIDKTPQ